MDVASLGDWRQTRTEDRGDWPAAASEPTGAFDTSLLGLRGGRLSQLTQWIRGDVLRMSSEKR